MLGAEFDRFVEDLSAADPALLTHPAERALLRTIAGFGRIIRQAATAAEPHRPVFALQEIAAQFHAYWNLGKEDAAMRFLLPEQPELTRARLALLQGIAFILRTGLRLTGVTPCEEM